jgi:tRNA_anti-like
LKTFLSVVGAICVLFFLLFVGIAVFSTASKGDSTNVASSAADATNSSAAPVLSVTAPKLFIDYQSNEVQADNIYKGKRLAVQGMVTSIQKDFMNNIIVALGTTNEFMSVDARLVQDESARAAQLQRGEIVNVVCDGGGMIVGSPQLQNCVFQAVNDSQPAPAPTATQPVEEQPQQSQESNATETVSAPTQETSQPSDDNESKPAPIVRQPPPETQPQL